MPFPFLKSLPPLRRDDSDLEDSPPKLANCWLSLWSLAGIRDLGFGGYLGLLDYSAECPVCYSLVERYRAIGIRPQ